jgi:hypothetical protein
LLRCDRVCRVNASTFLSGAALLAALTGMLLAQKPELTEDFEFGKINPALGNAAER